jgi:hypothetical protein
MVKEEREKKKKRMTKSEKEDLLIENFVGLQKAMTYLSLKFETLSDNLSRFLEVLELSAKNYLTKESPQDASSSELAKQVNYLIEQNKALAEGLLLIDDTIRKKSIREELDESTRGPSSHQKTQSKPLPKTI